MATERHDRSKVNATSTGFRFLSCFEIGAQGVLCSVEHDPVSESRSKPDSAIQDRNRIGLDFEKDSTGSDMDIRTTFITAVKCLRVFSDVSRIGSNVWAALPD